MSGPSSPLLDAIRDEIAARRATLEQLGAQRNELDAEIVSHGDAIVDLQEMHEKAVRLAGGAEPEAPNPPPSRKKTPAAKTSAKRTAAKAPPRSSNGASAVARPGARDVEAKVQSVVLKANGPLSFAQIVERSEQPETQARKALQKLVNDGKIEAQGATKARRYRKVKHERPSELGRSVEASAERNKRSMAEATDRIVLRDRVLKAIAADPESLTEHRLAQALDVDVTAIGEACEWLVDHNKITAHADSTYSVKSRRALAA